MGAGAGLTVCRKLQSWIDVVLGDIRDPLCVREAMRGCDQVFHLAALIAIPTAMWRRRAMWIPISMAP